MTATKKQELACERNWAKLRLANCHATVTGLQSSEVTTGLEKGWLGEAERHLRKVLAHWDIGSEGLGMKIRSKEFQDERK